MTDQNSETPSRLDQLDGLRGLAALSVLVFHFLLAFAPQLAPGHGHWPVKLDDSPLGIVANGRFSVSVFFALSGFVVANAAALRRDPILVSVVLRYFRLAIPMLASVIFAWMLLSLFPTAATSAQINTQSHWLALSYQAPIPDLIRAIYESMIGVFLKGQSLFNNVLWTMRLELVGSLVIYGIFWATKGILRWGLLGLWAACTIASVLPVDYLAFALGAILREVWARNRLPSLAAPLVLLCGLALGAPVPGFSERWGISWLPTRLTPGEDGSIVPSVASTLIVWGALQWKLLAAALSLEPFRQAGRLSFPIYLTHAPLFYTLGSALYVALFPLSFWDWVAIIGALVATTLCAAQILETTIDAPYLRWTKKVRFVIGQWMAAGDIGLWRGRPRAKW